MNEWSVVTCEHCWRMECGVTCCKLIADTKRCDAFKKRSDSAGGRKSRHAKAKATSSLPFVHWNADTLTSPASCTSSWRWLHKCCHNNTLIITSSHPSCLSLTNPTTVRIVTGLRTGRSGVLTPESALQILRTVSGIHPASHLGYQHRCPWS
jgi:hypothetical protein